MSEQLRLFDEPAKPVRMHPATVMLGKHWVAACRKVLDAATHKP